ncbi:glutamylglutaminyl-tRNA synthetase [Sulfurospirillum multivorans]|uniref:Glutamate--tRNA ligase n=2 Tax=Sulfurospirillum multivorans TaxID=66821 RepID=A0AA86DXL7_SULMK|nr:glutamylglutaminyl-tRNA synthetase [Sulfurospirillum multivorans]AHJ12153.1 glutamate--tRNA ligase [Sulfurospirillum multivorans DSM 12446]QEH05654.1 glutamate--tRNA ligase [Sulfurospirillum multivorans]
MYRFAPSPTGDMSVNDLRIALLNSICAQQASEPLIVRIEDGDRARTIEGKDQEILEMLELFGISYAQLYYQSSNFKYHLQFASTLLDTKKAFICFCPHEDEESPCDGTCEHLSPEEVLNTPKPFVIRMKTCDSFVIMRTDKYPTYTFACACDDMLQGVTTIIREVEQEHNALKEEHIRKSIGYDQAIHYTHVPSLLCKEDESAVKRLLDQGFMPEAIVNYLLLLSSATPTEIFTLKEATTWFDIKTISQSPAPFEIEKLRFINREHIKRIPDMELSKRIGYACENIGKLAKLYTKEASTTYEIKQKVDALFAQKAFDATFENESKLLQELILHAPYCETFDAFKAYLAEKSGLKDEPFLKPLRFWLTGADTGLDLALIYPLIKNYLKEIVR